MAGHTDEDDDRRAGSDHNRADIGGDANAPVVVGSHNLVIDAEHGSTVTVLMAGRRPRPERRTTVALLPRGQRAPLGREAELALLAAAVAAGETVQLCGPAGVGKSALLRYAARALPPGEDGVLFLDAARREPEDLAQDMFEACYESSGYAPSSSDLRALMTGLRVTVYVDNADYTTEQLRTFMDTAPDAAFVFASRAETLLGDDGRARHMAGLGLDAAMELLGRELGWHVVRADEQDIATALWETAAGLPLPLLRAAALARLDPSGAAVLPRPGAVAELLPALFARLDGPARRALHLLALLGDAELDPAHLAELDGAADPGALYASLAALGLAEETERGYRAVADVVPALREHGGPQPFSVPGLCEHFTRWAGRATTTPAQVADHIGVLERITELAERAGRPDLAVRLARAASPSLARSLRFGVWGRLLDRGLPVARRAGDRRAEAYFTHEQGIRALLTGNRVAAAVLLAGAGHLWRELGDLQGADAAAGAQQYVPQQPPSAPTPDADVTQASLSPDGGAAHPAPPGEAGAAHPPPSADSAATQATQTSTPPQDPTATHASTPPPDPASAHAANPPGPDIASSAHPAPAQPPAPASTPPPAPASAPPDVSAAVPVASAHSAGSGTAAAILKVLAAVAVVVIGSVAVDQYKDSRNTARATTPTPSHSTPATPYTPDTSVYDRQPDLYEEEEPTPEPTPEPTGLAGVWRFSNGSMMEFVESGTDSYTVTGQNSCGDVSTTEFTGGGGTYSSSQPVYDAGNDCATLGAALVTVTLGTDPDTAEYSAEMTAAYQEGAYCSACGSHTLTRVS